MIHIHISWMAVRITDSAMQKVKSGDGLGFYTSPKRSTIKVAASRTRASNLTHHDPAIMSRVPLASRDHKCQLSVNRQNSTLDEVNDKPKSGSCSRRSPHPSVSSYNRIAPRLFGHFNLPTAATER